MTPRIVSLVVLLLLSAFTFRSDARPTPVSGEAVSGTSSASSGKRVYGQGQYGIQSHGADNTFGFAPDPTGHRGATSGPTASGSSCGSCKSNNQLSPAYMHRTIVDRQAALFGETSDTASSEDKSHGKRPMTGPDLEHIPNPFTKHKPDSAGAGPSSPSSSDAGHPARAPQPGSSTGSGNQAPGRARKYTREGILREMQEEERAGRAAARRARRLAKPHQLQRGPFGYPPRKGPPGSQNARP